MSFWISCNKLQSDIVADNLSNEFDLNHGNICHTNAKGKLCILAYNVAYETQKP